MLHAIMCAFVIALSFIGFMTLIYFLLLILYKPKGRSRYILKFKSGSENGEIERQIYGVYFKKLLFGDLIFDIIEFDDSELSENEKLTVKTVCNDIGFIFKKNNSDCSGKENNG